MDDPDAGTQVLAERVGMSNTACWRKIEKLQDLGIIKELAIEEIMDNKIEFAKAENIGRARRVDDGLGRYVESAKATYQFNGSSLKGIKIVLDCANGAAYKVAPQVLFELGAEVVPLGVSPNGYNINLECGSTSPELAAKKVLEIKADLGICLDGDRWCW